MFIARNKNTGVKALASFDYNYRFEGSTGKFYRWGKTLDDNPEYSKFGPEILDLEVSTVCSGIPTKENGNPKVCKHCYKSNTPRGENMSFDTFKTIFDKMPQTLTQIAFGIGDIWANQDLVRMWDYCRNNSHNPGVVPNVTINGHGLTDEWVNNLKEYCGAVAVSVYDYKHTCYDAVKKLTDAGMTQCNIHCLVAEETFDRCLEVLQDAATDPRLAKLNAVVLLTLKPKGNRNNYHNLKSIAKYRQIIDKANSLGVTIGFDSCSAPIYLAAMKDSPNFEQLSALSESCESGLFSSYINTEGRYFHCSFTEDEPGWQGVDVLAAEDFIKDVWFSEETRFFRDKLLNSVKTDIASDCRLCPIFPKDLYEF